MTVPLNSSPTADDENVLMYKCNYWKYFEKPELTIRYLGYIFFSGSIMVCKFPGKFEITFQMICSQ